MDETGCFWKAPPDSGFGESRKECKGGKKCKQTMSVALIVNAAGGKETPFAIWKSENPRCFKKVVKGSLPVKHFSQWKSWLTGEILDAVLASINCQLVAKSLSPVDG